MSKRAFTQQRRLFLTALYLLVWGEASNLRFMPECLCYIFHHMADELFDLLEQPYVERSKCVKPNADNNVEFSFLEQIITPVYQVVAAVSISLHKLFICIHVNRFSHVQLSIGTVAIDFCGAFFIFSIGSQGK
jgi:hypothetical protein